MHYWCSKYVETHYYMMKFTDVHQLNPSTRLAAAPLGISIHSLVQHPFSRSASILIRPTSNTILHAFAMRDSIFYCRFIGTVNVYLFYLLPNIFIAGWDKFRHFILAIHEMSVKNRELNIVRHFRKITIKRARRKIFYLSNNVKIKIYWQRESICNKMTN